MLQMLAAARPTLGHYRGGSLTHLMLSTAFLHIQPKGHRGPRNEPHMLGYHREHRKLQILTAQLPVTFQDGIYLFEVIIETLD